MRRILEKEFFERPAEVVSKDLIGKYIVRRLSGKTVRLLITETEAYVGPHDLACHASKGRTQRTEGLFGEAGRFYVYFVYGMHYLLNIVTNEKDYPAGVLIRGAREITGPARLTKFLTINKSFYGKRAIPKTGLWFEEGDGEEKFKIKKTPRIGVDFAGPIWSKKLLRFVLQIHER
ncbi:DNA-3-methyladenine glycosylase [Candidatus Parcubacteria bacterium]|nr:DNA-3-methyladenine glycosylase [Candidatus Parcubacteria bacterium]